jgi:EpsI family protein
MMVVLLTTGTIINVWERTGETSVSRILLKDFPNAVGAWRQAGSDERYDPEVENILHADDYISRNFTNANGGRANFYVGYYATQRNGATYHSPLNCLPGQGWTMSEGSLVRISPKQTDAFDANRYIVQNGADRELMLYWYQGRGRIVISEYWGKIYTVIDSFSRRRSDGAIVRVMVPVGSSEEQALETAKDLAAQVAPLLPAYLPK